MMVFHLVVHLGLVDMELMCSDSGKRLEEIWHEGAGKLGERVEHTISVSTKPRCTFR